MKILALESSAAACSAALCEDGVLLAQMWQNSGLTHSCTLLPMVEDMLKNCGASLEDVDIIAAAAGPGSFTGLRIGIATAKGLAWPKDLPCAPCSTLESMAWLLSHLDGTVIVCAMDARRNQVYNALFEAKNGQLFRLTEDRAISLAELENELKKFNKPIFLVGDGSFLTYNTLKETVSMVLPPESRMHQRAVGVGLLALQKIALGEPGDGAALTPNYLRLSQAERERNERQAKKQ